MEQTITEQEKEDYNNTENQIIEGEIKKAKKYQVIGYIKVEPEEIEPLTYEEAVKEKEQGELMQPQDIFKIEEIE